jgi:DNA-binding transcriptional LysR family regulator
MQDFEQSDIAMLHPGLFELNAVAAISAHRSFRAAATELGISPSALSHAIASLEKRLGVRLINRTTRSVSLSEAGERFLARISPALREIAGALEEVNEFRDTPAGKLRINLTERAAQQILRPIVARFLRRYPDMNVELTLEGRIIDIVAEGFDAGIRLAEAVPQDMVAIPCGPDTRFIAVGAPDYFARAPLPQSPSDLLNHECIRRRLPSGKLYRWEFEKRGEQMAVDVPGRLTLDNDSLMVEGRGGRPGARVHQRLLGDRTSRRRDPASRAGRLDAAIPRLAPLLSPSPAHDGRPSRLRRHAARGEANGR